MAADVDGLVQEVVIALRTEGRVVNAQKEENGWRLGVVQWGQRLTLLLPADALQRVWLEAQAAAPKLRNPPITAKEAAVHLVTLRLRESLALAEPAHLAGTWTYCDGRFVKL